MKPQSIKSRIFFLFVLSSLFITAVSAQETKNDENAWVKNAIEAKQYVFKAERAFPASGRTRQLSPGYKLELRTDTLVSDLPYYGRAYSAPIDPAQAGIQFTSTSFEYSATQGKKGRWNISIKPKDARDVNQISLDISKDGRTSVQVISNNRQAISFDGYITEVKKK